MIEITEQDYKNILKKNKLPKKLLNQGITIVMPKAEAAKWLRNLRSGRYKQAEGSLYCTQSGGYCCLGLQQKGAVNQIEYVTAPYGSGKESTPLLKPTKWLDKENFFDDKTYGEVRGFPSLGYLRSRGIFYSGFDGRRKENPSIPSVDDVDISSAADLNDNGYTFKEIATLLEKHMAVY